MTRMIQFLAQMPTDTKIFLAAGQATSNCSAFKANFSQLALSREGCHRQFSDFKIEVEPGGGKGWLRYLQASSSYSGRAR